MWALWLTCRPPVWPRNSCVTAHDRCSTGNYRGWPQRPCLALGPYPSPIQFPSRLSQNSSSLAQTPSQFFTLLSIMLLMPPAIFIFSVSLPPPLLLWTWSSIDFLPISPAASSVLHFFFFPNQFFSATPTQFFSWLPPPLAYSTFQSLMTFNNHLYELRAFVPESWITWSSSSSSNHMAIWRASTKAMKSHTHLQAGPLLRSIGHIFADRTAEKSIFYGYTQIRYLLFILTQALQFLADTVNYFWVAQEFY